MHNIKFGTGINSIDKKMIDADIYNDVIEGRIQDPAIIKDLQSKLEKNGINELQISGDNLLAHTGEVDNPESNKLANCLMTADNSLLSPHKVLAAPFIPDTVGRIASYVGSMADNMNALTKEEQQVAHAWEKEVYISILNAADELQGEKTSKDYKKMSMDAIKDKIKSPETWGEYAFDATKPESKEKFDEMYSVIQKQYQKTCDNSVNMFKID